jgi:hypothetical protein
MPQDDPAAQDAETECDALRQQVRHLQERLAFYEGFDLLIQDNVAQARELFRLAAQEREAAASLSERSRREAGEREATLRSDLEAIAADLEALSRAVGALSRRVTQALGESSSGNGRAGDTSAATTTTQPVAVVVHGVPSARTALSLQRFVASLPQVADVATREFVGGVLRLDARVEERLQVDQFSMWEDPRRIEALTERPDVIELELQEPEATRAQA